LKTFMAIFRWGVRLVVALPLFLFAAQRAADTWPDGVALSLFLAIVAVGIFFAAGIIQADDGPPGRAHAKAIRAATPGQIAHAPQESERHSTFWIDDGDTPHGRVVRVKAVTERPLTLKVFCYWDQADRSIPVSRILKLSRHFENAPIDNPIAFFKDYGG